MEIYVKNLPVKDFDMSRLSFVVQGVFYQKYTPKIIKKIKQLFPTSPIILSTYANDEISTISSHFINEVIFNEDPGGFTFAHGYYDNTNRQIISTLHGLYKVRTEYACKVRSDLLIASNKFAVNYFAMQKKFPFFDKNFRIYNERILVYIFSSKFKHLDEITPFHISDWIFMGLTNDLIKQFSLPLKKFSDSYFCSDHWPENKPRRIYENPQKYFPEQYICYMPYAIEKGKIGFSNRFCNSEKIQEISNKFITNNYIILNHHQMPVYLLKKSLCEYYGYNFEYWNNCINHYKWIRLYEKYFLGKPSLHNNIYIYIYIEFL